MDVVMTPGVILDFWFSQPMASHWFSSSAEIDADIRKRFAGTWRSAGSGELDHWKESAEGALALCILLDQFPINMFRGQPESFATEAYAVAVTLEAVARGYDQQLAEDQLAFLYMPLMHSEIEEYQDRSVELFEAAGLEANLRFARHHRDLIKCFGRFPHRNAILGRASTQEELDYLDSDEAFTG